MKLTMHYLLFYPEREIRVIAQMLKNAKLFSSMPVGKSEDHNLMSNIIDAEGEFLFDEFLDEVEQLSNQATIVALNSLIEITLKRILFAKRPSSEKKNNIDRKILEQKLIAVGVHLRNATNFAEIDEMRQLANSIKHCGTGIVDPIVTERYFAASKSFLIQVCSESAQLF